MAKQYVSIGMGKTYYAVMTDVENETYETVKFLADGIELGITPNEEMSQLFAGDKPIITESGMKDISVTVTIPGLTTDQMCDIFGMSEAVGGGLISNANDTKRYICLMAEKHLNDGVTEYIHLYKGKLSLAEDKMKTAEGSRDYQTVVCNGQFLTLDNGDWKYSVRSDDTGFAQVEWDKTWAKSVVKPAKKTV